MERNRENVRFQRNTGHISETVKDRAKVTVNHTLSDEMEIIDFGWPWRSVRPTLQQERYRLQRVFPSDSWAFLLCFNLANVHFWASAQL